MTDGEASSAIPGFDLPVPDDLLTVLALTPAAPGRKPWPEAPIEISLVRALTPADATEISNRPPSTGARDPLKRIRHSHHQLAQLIAQGREQAEIALVTGYSPGYISVIKQDPTFRELIAYYSTERKAIFVDTLERMKSLGITVMEELQQRVADEPEKWSNRELMEFAKLLLIEPERKTAGYQSGGPNGPGVSVTVNFVSPPDREPAGPAIEGAIV